MYEIGVNLADVLKLAIIGFVVCRCIKYICNHEEQGCDEDEHSDY